jgi:hypothetical protein
VTASTEVKESDECGESGDGYVFNLSETGIAGEY